MNYKLKRDLPFAKAGSEVVLEGDVVIVQEASKQRIAVRVEDDPDWYTYRFIGHKKNLNRFIKEGWIEEVKPREWWKLYREGLGLLIANFKTKEEAVKHKANNGSCVNDEIIKVREVL